MISPCAGQSPVTIYWSVLEKFRPFIIVNKTVLQSCMKEIRLAQLEKSKNVWSCDKNKATRDAKNADGAKNDSIWSRLKQLTEVTKWRTI